MNLTVSSSTWKHARTRYIVGISGVALALSVAIGGIGSLPSSGGREASVAPETLSRQGTVYATDADYAAIGAAYIRPQAQEAAPRFATAADAEDAARSMALAIETFSPPVAAVRTTEPRFANVVDAVDASIALALETATSVSPLFYNMADAVEAATH